MNSNRVRQEIQDFTGVNVFVGADVHLKRWVVTIRAMQLELKTFSMNPSASELADHLRRNYPGANYSVAYEAGFCGFGIYDVLTEAGIACTVVHAADVPTTNKEKVTKRDKVDSRKLARELEKGGLDAIYVPSPLQRELRSLSRYRESLTKDQTRTKNRIKSHLYFFGVDLTELSDSKHWSARFIADLMRLTTNDSAFSTTLKHLLETLLEQRQRMLQVVRELRQLFRQYRGQELRSLMSTPGVGFLTASVLLAEVGDPRRFANEDKLRCYVGLVPSTHGSGESERTGGLTPRRNSRLKHLIIEAAWTAIRKDADLTLSFHKYACRMLKTEAIIRIAAKLLNRIRRVWVTGELYKFQTIAAAQ